MQYLGNIHWFQVTSLKPSTTSHHDSLLIDMSNMSLDVDCSTDSVEVDGAMVDTKNDVAHMPAVCSTNCNFFIVTLQSHVIIQTCSSNLVSCSIVITLIIIVLIYQPRIMLDAIKGMDQQVKLMYEIVVIPLGAPDAFRSRGMQSIRPRVTTTHSCGCCSGIDLPRGVLLYGVKGVGKSLLAQAVAYKSGARVISIASQQALLWYLLKILYGC